MSIGQTIIIQEESTTVTTTKKATETASGSNDRHEYLDHRAIVGIACGGAAFGAVLIAILCWWLIRTRVNTAFFLYWARRHNLCGMWPKNTYSSGTDPSMFLEQRRVSIPSPPNQRRE